MLDISIWNLKILYMPYVMYVMVTEILFAPFGYVYKEKIIIFFYKQRQEASRYNML